ncbi:MAG TPA: zinc dependent phospholipase C family protein [Gemmatimonadaceae bacterium]
MRTLPVRWRAACRVCSLLAIIPLVAAATWLPEGTHASATERRWKINTHLFAANVALADATNDGMVTIAPFGEFAVPPDVVKALKEAPASYRAGVLAPDLFPDMYVGGWVLHSDLTKTEKWTADEWLRHVWTKARTWPNDSDRSRVLAFGYGMLTHGAGDIFAHTWVNQKAGGAWLSFQGKERETAIKHIVLEGFVGEHTPTTDLSLDVWPRFVANTLIKDSVARQHNESVAKHYHRFLAIADGLPAAIARAKGHMNDNIRNDAPYWMKCTANPVWCARKEQMEVWQRDINRGFRALVDSSESLGEMLMAGEAGSGVDAMTGWGIEWLPKMFGAHALGEGTGALNQFLQWAGDLVPIDSLIKAEVEGFMKNEFPEYWKIYVAAKKPSTYMESSRLFPTGTKQRVIQEMGVRPGGSTFEWRDFEPIYNTVTLSKLALLDANGLNELLRRAQVSKPLFAVSPATNIMLGVFKSMTQSYQWIGDSVYTDTGSTITKFGICGPETEASLPPRAICGVEHVAGRGFVLWGNQEAREKVFKVIFKGYGPGPGTTDHLVTAQANVAFPLVREGRRALRAATDQAEYMRDVVADMQGKVAGIASAAAPNVAPAVPAAQPKGRTPAVAPTTTRAPVKAPAASISDWGSRCCSKDIAELRSAMNALIGSSRRVQNPALLAAFGRRASFMQLGARAAQLNAALDAFATTKDSASATSALAVVARHVESIAAVVAGTQ